MLMIYLVLLIPASYIYTMVLVVELFPPFFNSKISWDNNLAILGLSTIFWIAPSVTRLIVRIPKSLYNLNSIFFSLISSSGSESWMTDLLKGLSERDEKPKEYKSEVDLKSLSNSHIDYLKRIPADILAYCIATLVNLLMLPEAFKTIDLANAILFSTCLAVFSALYLLIIDMSLIFYLHHWGKQNKRS